MLMMYCGVKGAVIISFAMVAGGEKNIKSQEFKDIVIF